MDEGEISHDLTVSEYNENFINHFGEPDPNHTWGMGLSMGDGKSTRVNVVNKNEWVNQYHLEVPGWPDVYNTTSGGSVIGDYKYATSGGSYVGGSANDPGESYIPAGDVTQEEIQYVSWWFRTHYKPQSEIVHWSDFFIHEISSDCDRVMTTGANQGEKINTVALYKRSQETNELIYDHEVAVGGYNIDKLQVKTFDGSGTGVDGYDGYDHISNFNHDNSNKMEVNMDKLFISGDTTGIWADNVPYTGIRCQFYTSSGTEDFNAHYSNDDKWRAKADNIWVIKHLHFVGPSGRIYDGWYIGFDYAYYGQEQWQDEQLVGYQERKADGYYSNWILKITPATPVTPEPSDIEFTRRVMCEDLGNTYDFDFNDVVFDATYNITEDEYRAYLAGTKLDTPIDVTITIQAAGGTMPIYVGVDPDVAGSDKYEAHALLNHDASTPVNVGGASSHVAIYHVEVPVPQDAVHAKEALNLNSIPIYVINGGKKIAIKNNGTEYYANEDHPNHYNPSNIGTNNVPQKFAVPTSVRWMKECRFIETAYPHFCDWVKDENGAYREKRNTGTADWQKPWYDNSNILESGKSNLAGSGFGYNAPNTDIDINDPIVPENPVGPDYSEFGTILSMSPFAEYQANSVQTSAFEGMSSFTLNVIFETQNDNDVPGDGIHLKAWKLAEDGNWDTFTIISSSSVEDYITRIDSKHFVLTFSNISVEDISSYTKIYYDGQLNDRIIGYRYK